jgi:hypothetical protein
MQYFRFAFTAVALCSIANSSPLLYEAATAKQALGIDPIPAKFDSDYENNPASINRPTSNDYNPASINRPASNDYNPASMNKPTTNHYANNDIDITYSLYRSSLQTLAKEIRGRSSIQRTSSSSDNSRAAYHTAQTSFEAFRVAAKPTPVVCAAIRLIPAEDQETAVKYISFVQHTADEAYAHSVEGDGQSAYWDFCLIDDYMGAVNAFVEREGNVYNGRSIGTY